MATETVWSKIDRAHQLYRDLKHRDALELYTEALGLAKTKSQNIALHSNRAACYLKLHDFKKVAQECTSVLEWDQQHTGALMLRAQTLVTLKEYPSALFDVNRLMELNPASDVYRNLQARLKTQLSLATIPESEDELMYHGEDAEANTLYKLKRKNMARLISPSEAAITESENHVAPQGWEAIPKPRGHSGLDYSRWDRVEENSSEDEDDEAELQKPQYRFRVRTAGVIRPVK